MPVSRRTILGLAAAPLLGAVSGPAKAAPRVQQPKVKVVFTGGHPGDPECGCSGTIARYTGAGHEVVLLYLNRGEGFCGKAPLSQCAGIRTAEAQKACGILGARAAFAGQYDGRAVVDDAHYDQFRRLLVAEKPDVVFTHWPVDQHRDHRVVATLVLDAWLKDGKSFTLYYYEVAGDTMMFSPTEYVDVSGVMQKKRESCYAHASQNPDGWYAAQEQIMRFRGMESGHAEAEAFVRHWESTRAGLP